MYILAIFPSKGGKFFVQIDNKEEFEEIGNESLYEEGRISTGGCNFSGWTAGAIRVFQKGGGEISNVVVFKKILKN